MLQSDKDVSVPRVAPWLGRQRQRVHIAHPPGINFVADGLLSSLVSYAQFRGDHALPCDSSDTLSLSTS
jgi:hypothetical protein